MKEESKVGKSIKDVIAKYKSKNFTNTDGTVISQQDFLKQLITFKPKVSNHSIKDKY